jgi:hypothetical protein
MTHLTTSEYVRITYFVGSEKGTKWTKNIHVDADGMVGFVDVETGQKKYLPPNVEYIVTEVEELPPAVRDAAIESGSIDPAESEPMGATNE